MTDPDVQRAAPDPDPEASQAEARWQRHVPEAIRALDTMVDPDYCDIFTATGSQASGRAAEQRFRAVLAEVPDPVLLFMRGVQRGFLGFRLGPRRGLDYLEGWRIAARGDSWVRVETGSWFMTAHCILYADGDELALAAFVRYDRPIGRWIWRPVALIHRQVGLALMRSAAKLD